MKKKILLIDMFSIYKQIYNIEDSVTGIVNKGLDKINNIFSNDLQQYEEVFFIFENREYEKESYENKKEVKIRKKNYEFYEMGKNYLIEILKVDNNKFKIFKIPKIDHDCLFSNLCKKYKNDSVEIYSKNMLLCKNLSLNVTYRNDSESLTLDSFIDTFGFIPNKYSITFYFFLKSYIESEVMSMIMKDYNKSDSFNSFNLYTKSLDFDTQNTIKKTIRKIKDIFEFYDYKQDKDLDLEYLIYNCQNNSIKKELLLSSIGLKYKKSTDAEKFFNV
jgi:hypothetical protein